MRKNKLMISAITLAFAVVAVVSTTFAWFTMNTTNTVEDMDFTATSGSGLYMSLDGTNYYTSLNINHFKDFALASGNENKIKGFKNGENLNPVTLLADGTTLATSTKSVATTGYVQFTLHFKSSVKSTVKVSDLTLKTVFAEDVIAPSVTLNDVSEFWDAHGASEGSIKLETVLANAARVKVEAIDGETKASQYIDPNLNAGYKGIETVLANSVSHQYLNHVSPKEAKEIVSKYGENVSSVIYTDYKGLQDTTLLTLKQSGEEFVGSVTVTLWIEGFDQDCFDVLFKQNLTFGISFEATKVEQQ